MDKCLTTCTCCCHIIQNSFTALMILCASHSHSPSPEFSSVAQLCLILWDPVDCSLPRFPVHHQLPEFAQTISIELVIPSNHLILCCLLLPSVFRSVRVFSNESLLHIRWLKELQSVSSRQAHAPQVIRGKLGEGVRRDPPQPPRPGPDPGTRPAKGETRNGTCLRSYTGGECLGRW